MEIGIRCSSAFRSLIEDGSDSLGKEFNCLISFVFIAVILNAHLSLFGSLKYLFQRMALPRMHGVFGLVTIGCFFYLFLVRFTLASIQVKFCDLPVTLAIETDSAPTGFDGINVHGALLLTKASYFCGFDYVKLMNLHNLKPTVFPCLSLARGRASLSLFFSPGHMFWRSFEGIRHVVIIIIHGSLVMGY